MVCSRNSHLDDGADWPLVRPWASGFSIGLTRSVLLSVRDVQQPAYRLISESRFPVGSPLSTVGLMEANTPGHLPKQQADSAPSFVTDSVTESLQTPENPGKSGRCENAVSDVVSDTNSTQANDFDNAPSPRFGDLRNRRLVVRAHRGVLCQAKTYVNARYAESCLSLTSCQREMSPVQRTLAGLRVTNLSVATGSPAVRLRRARAMIPSR